ncbi:sensor histidine kinase [Virgibacillus halodenitrificans]|uniref:Sensor histidine kinase n=1 Tax=Virgibacillus halodenitrificans TaxID=1482 RepID=A0AAC9IYE0_VIRHA|nr:sensor histidine kinase [Virgibacillus halodenitrificans]APC47448.1 sensor histidine kinase [Virgibacillus halodenitrificans]MBD1221732.1 sensor histidine kinase [Virgibacillus halodenitrificans]MCG1029490.1 sensor histidine kinase [Virgibacillus halodenitrificans]MEC2160719.1 sensor histidine kinase [Virgibacillus halodenitrificans]MYL46257.1 sensor histidine kinase [Virgibacillus halodenitrificans]
MINRFSSIRYSYIRSHLYGLFLTSITLLSLLLSIYVIFEPAWLTAPGIFLFISLYIVIGTILSLYAGFKSSGDMKERLEYLSVLITRFANGSYTSRVYFNEEDELARIGNEMNELGEKLQNQVKALRQRADEKAEFAKSAHKAAVIEERQRLARDLHDAVSQQLFALTMMAEAAVKQMDRDSNLAKEQMVEVTKAALQSQAEMRALLLHLRPIHLSGDTLSTGIQKLVDELKQKSTIAFKLNIPSDLQLADTIEEHVFRIIQESLSNILRHANASEVEISLSKPTSELFVHIRDDGEGFDSTQDMERKTSYGLKTMKERSEELGGTFTIRSNTGEGTYIDIRIPC